MTNQIKVTATVRQIMDADLWDEYCNLTGCNPRAMNEGQIDKGETVDVPFNLVGRLIDWDLKQKPRASFPKRTKLYLHGDKDNHREKGEELGLEGEALRMFAHALYEVEFDVEVGEDGACRIIAVDGKPLATGKHYQESPELISELEQTRDQFVIQSVAWSAINKAIEALKVAVRAA